MRRSTITTLRALIVLLLLGTLIVQAWIIPVLAGETASVYPEVSYLQVPFTVLAILVVLCFQLGLVCIWRLLSMVARDRIFSTGAFRYVDAIVVALLVATALLGGIDTYLTFVLHANPPLVALLLAGGVVGGAALALLMVVMRGLLQKALRLESDLSEVI